MKKLYRDLTGQQFTRLIVIEVSHQTYDQKRQTYKTFWKCQCSCGEITFKCGNLLTRGTTKSCGCLKREWSREKNPYPIKNLVGQKFGMLTVLALSPKRRGKQKRAMWYCKCDCNNFTETCGADLKTGTSTSCGCKTRRRGPECHFWKTTKTDEERIIDRKTSEYYVWRKAAYQRDNFTCQLSGQRGGELQVHHLESWSSNKELRYEVSNGITLRKNIHKLFHKLYGNGHNTVDQFKDFQGRYNNKEFDPKYY